MNTSHQEFATFKATTSALLNNMVPAPTIREASAIVAQEAKKCGYNPAAVSFRLSTTGVFTVV